jgi:hypothetical protein
MGQSQALQEEEEPLVVVPFAMNQVSSCSGQKTQKKTKGSKPST